MGWRRVLVVLGPLVGLIGLGHLVDGRRLHFLVASGAGWLLLLDAWRSVGVAMEGVERFGAVGAAFSCWLYMLLALFVARRTWHPVPEPAEGPGAPVASSQ